MLLKHTTVGSVLTTLFLHPLTMTIYWFEFNDRSQSLGADLLIVLERILLSFSSPMSPMIGLFLLLGAILGFGSGWYYRELRRKDRLLRLQSEEIEQSIHSLIGAGEGARLEFKSSMRWDHVHEKPNKSLEHAALKTLAGFMNATGGTLLLGVDNEGTVLGLEPDYSTLKRADRDGYELHLMNLVAAATRADFCSLVHIRFSGIDGTDVCAVTVEASDQPVYVHQGAEAKYFLRVGNATRELNTQEAVEHVARRFGKD